MAEDNESNTGFVLALIGAGAALAWLLWRGRGASKAGSGTGDLTQALPEVVIRICSGDRVSVDGVGMDLAAAVERARHATIVDVYPRGDARHGWVKDVHDALQAAGAHIVLHPLGYRLPKP